ncbi:MULTISPECIES: transcription antitermination factor NusB [Clostridium]|jgi:N utilization substance protein B|uniref:Transcription antitermination protein NusB n=2 Tax=Clostridium beijerinckii TaxID=1520 RepID=A0AAW3W731_CLOBE|nr:MULTISPECIES: transcription antitermination factor NusB [Clostridium]MBC2457228.1 transcription antitermination factor NusB [Clostridium beijerinckii]MBC2474284.1 transcription antitermination factor NusB [Clostridium beijerinckii]MCI1579351.1 transcription antitermination factor NusB [Clostridium beijerinckii]MCI1582350.1 transcription antitermination factor NusB [Clostridium beijerinckii]MCI1622040.1 transcription antitermination factor NusB [Clostridium beijerinckii]
MNRKLSREKAMELLFGMTLSKDTMEDAVEAFVENYEGDIKEIDLTYVKQVLIGVSNNKEAIDKVIQENLHNWKIERISKVNLSILRIATYELLYDKEVPRGVAINEALEITRRYSDEKSVSFINGVLDKIKQD